MKPIYTPADLRKAIGKKSRQELQAMVEAIAERLLVKNESGNESLNTQDEVGGADFVQDVARQFYDHELWPKTVTCKLCGKETPAGTAHLHQGQWVGECCWDERLRTTE